MISIGANSVDMLLLNNSWKTPNSVSPSRRFMAATLTHVSSRASRTFEQRQSSSQTPSRQLPQRGKKLNADILFLIFSLTFEGRTEFFRTSTCAHGRPPPDRRMSGSQILSLCSFYLFPAFKKLVMAKIHACPSMRLIQ